MPNKKYKTEWDLKKFYKKNRELDAHLDKIEKGYKAFEKKYKNKDFTKTEESLLRALKDSEKLSEELNESKPGFYLFLANSLDSSDQKIEAKLNTVTERLTELENRILFFSLRIGKIDKKKQDKYLKSKKLAPYRYMLEKAFENAKYNLKEEEEKILNLMSLPSAELWIRGVEKAQGKQTIKHKKKEIPLTKAISLLSSAIKTKERRELWSKIIEKLKNISDFSESEINALVLRKKITDKLRGFKHSYSASILAKENTEKEVLALVDIVTKKFSLSKKFYSLKKKALKIKDFHYVDRLAKIGEIKKKFGFKDSADILLKIFEETDGKFKEILNNMLVDGQIDVYPKKGKSGGAFCAGDTNLPTYVLLNHTDDYSSLNTFAHEMGHAIHTEMSKSQPARYQGYTISVAEVASNFFENVLFYNIFETLSDEEKLIALHDKIDGHLGSIFRQIAFFNFELELHETIRKKGSMSHKEIANLMTKHLKSYTGSSVKISEDDGYSYIYVSHFRSPFYVYAYAYGELIANALYQRYKEDPSYIEKIKEFLQAGGSKSPYDIFKEIGIDTRNPSFWKEGLKKIEKDINTFEKLIKKQ